MATSPQYDAVVIGSGPNGLVAAITIARSGRRVLVVEGQPTAGGGTRSAELTEAGFVHDVCSAIHPLGIASPALRTHAARTPRSALDPAGRSVRPSAR